MQYRKSFNLNSNNNPFGLIIGLLVGILIMIGLFKLANFLFQILLWLSPVLIIATLIIDYKVVWNYIQWVVNLIKRNTLAGIAMLLLTVFGFPVVSAFLLAKALFKRRVKQVSEQYEQHTKGEFIEYEELDSELLDLPDPQEKEPQTRTKNTGYENLFDQ